MPTLEQMFSVTDREAVNQAIRDAEGRTSAEIVPVIAAASGRYDRPEDVVGLWLGVICLSVVWSLCPVPVVEPGSWTSSAPVWHLLALIVAVVAGFIGGALIASRVPVICRLFTPRIQMQEEVLLRARAVFYDQRVHHTAGAGGILLYVSLQERMAAVIADESALQKLGQERVNAICADFTAQLHDKGPIAALCDTTRALGLELAPLLPRQSDDINELPDALRLLA